MNRSGFTLIEVMIGMLVFTIAMVALASSTGFVGMQLQASDLRTERSTAYQQVIEHIHATEFDAIASRASNNPEIVGEYSLWWNVTTLRWALKEVEVYAKGPAYLDGNRHNIVEDTLVFRVARPGL